jgi:hypothetical protein
VKYGGNLPKDMFFLVPKKDPRRDSLDARFEVFTAVKIRIEVLWVVTACGDAVGYLCFGERCFFYLQSEVMLMLMEVERPTENLVFYLNINGFII